MKHQNVIQIIDSLNPGGAEMMAVNIANDLANEGVASYLCSTRKEGLLKSKINKKVRYLFLTRTYFLDIQSFIILFKFIKKNNISIIHAHSTSFFIGFIMKLFNPKIKLIWHNHYGNSLKISKFKRNVYRFFTRYTNSIISVNNELHLWAKKHFKVENFVCLLNYSTLISNNNNTILKGVKGKRVVNVANLREEKDQINLLKSFLIVKSKHPNWSLHLVGNDKTDYSKKINFFINEHKLRNHVFLYGICSDISNILNQSSIGVLSSKFEGLPVVLLEYGLAKLPVVTTNVGDCNKVIINEKTGFLINPHEPKVMANKLLYLINNTEFSAKLGENLYKHVVLNFSKEKYIAKLVELYNA